MITVFKRYFETYEQREEAFRKNIGIIIPRKYLGPAEFWKDIRTVSFDKFLQNGKKQTAYITGNPADCLAFGTPFQVIKAVFSHIKGNIRLSAEEIIEHFGMSENIHQPVRTLSGGETVKLALAKVFTAAQYSSVLFIASPFCWLSSKSRKYFDYVLRHYNDLKIPVHILALEGEDSEEKIKKEEFGDIFDLKTDFSIFLKNVSVSFGALYNSIYSSEIEISIKNFEAKLNSPCLFTGDNGHGKSILAKVLAGALPCKGEARIISNKKEKRVRLLFQDVIKQTMLRNCPDESSEIYEKIITNFHDYCGSKTKIGIPNPLLKIKTALAAERLKEIPSALILDEPDWGLSRYAAAAFVYSTVKTSHQLGVPIIIISHKPWWKEIVQSQILIKRTKIVSDNKGNRSFEIILRKSNSHTPNK